MAAKAKTKEAVKTPVDYVQAVGRRRTASARVRVYKGDKESKVNDKLIGTYFPGAAATAVWQRPLSLTGVLGKFYVTAKVVGGGKQSQLEAVVHGIARALSAMDETAFRPALKSAGLLTRDSRERQRRQAGKGGKSRRAKQSPKR